MKFILIASDEPTSSFFPLWEVLFFGVIITCLLCLLYPQDLLQKVLAQEKPSAVALSYLQSFRKTNQQNPQFMLALIQQEIGMGQLHQAQIDMALLKKTATPEQATDLQWLEYLMLRGKTYKTKINTPIRIAYLRQLRDMGEQLSKAALKPSQLKDLALDSLWLGKPDVSLAIYNKLMANKQLSTADEFALGGNIAMQNNAQKDSSKFYWAAYQVAKNPKKQKEYALAAIKALWAGNYVKEATALADQLPISLIKDRDTLLYLSQLALAANQPEIAEKYALQALLLKTERKHE